MSVFYRWAALVSQHTVDRVVVLGFLAMFLIPEPPTGPLGLLTVRPYDYYLVAVLAPWFAMRFLIGGGRVRPVWPGPALPLLTVTALLSILWSADPAASVVASAQWFEFLVIVTLIGHCIQRRGDWSWVLVGVVLVALVLQVPDTINALAIKIGGYTRYRFSPDVAVVGAVGAAALALTSERHRVMSIVALIVLGGTVVISFSRTGVLALVGGVAAQLVITRFPLRRATWLVAVPALVVVLFAATGLNRFSTLWHDRVESLIALGRVDFEEIAAGRYRLDAGAGHRLAGYLMAVDVWKRQPLGGAGAGTLEKLAGPEAFTPFGLDYEYYARIAPYSRRALVIGHSFAFTVLAEMGLIGMVPFLLLLATPFLALRLPVPLDRDDPRLQFVRASAGGYGAAAAVYVILNPPGVGTYVLILLATALAAFLFAEHGPAGEQLAGAAE